MRDFVRIELTSIERERLESTARSRTLAARMVQRAKIILLTAEGHSQMDIAEALDCNVKTVHEWQARWMAEGFKGIEKERPGRGRKAWVLPNVSRELIRKTVEDTPEEATHWSTRRMAKAMGIGATLVRKIWKQHGLGVIHGLHDAEDIPSCAWAAHFLVSGACGRGQESSQP